MIDRYTIENALLYIGITIVILLFVGVIALLFSCVMQSFIWIIDMINGTPNTFTIAELLGLIIIFSAIFGGSTTTVVYKK